MGFASDTAVEDAGGGRYKTQICDGWDIGGKANGGYLLSIAARAMLDASGRPDPVTVTAHYLAPGSPGTGEITTEVVKRGRTFTTVTGALDAGDRRLLQVLGTFGDLSSPAGPGARRRRTAGAPATGRMHLRRADGHLPAAVHGTRRAAPASRRRRLLVGRPER